jgi:serine/threonine protein kinase
MYERVKEIGHGTSGRVFLVKNSKGSLFALKEIKIEKLTKSKEVQLVQDEISFLSKLKHPNIIKFEEHFCQDGAINIVMEYADGGDLHAFIRTLKSSNQKMSESSILDYLIQLCLGLS